MPELPTPNENRLLVRRVPKDWVSPGGVILPDYLPDGERDIPGLSNTTREANVATVLAIGPCRTDKGVEYTPEFNVGDIVVLDPYAGSDIDALDETCGKGCFLPHYNSVLAVFEGDPSVDLTVSPDLKGHDVSIGEIEMDAAEDATPLDREFTI